MSSTVSVLVRIDRTGNTVTLVVTGEPTAIDQQELVRMSERARDLFPETTVTVDLSSVRASSPQHLQWKNAQHRGDGEPEISSTPAPPWCCAGTPGRDTSPRISRRERCSHGPPDAVDRGTLHR